MTSAPSDPKPSEGGLPNPQRALAMLTICMGVILTSVDSVIANIALPTISDDLHASPASTIWAVTAYQLAVTVCILPLASLGERLGYRRVYLAGLTTFTIASLGCTFAHNLPMLVVFRALQGVGGAGLVSVSLAIVRFIYPRDRMGRGFGLYALRRRLRIAFYVGWLVKKDRIRAVVGLCVFVFVPFLLPFRHLTFSLGRHRQNLGHRGFPVIDHHLRIARHADHAEALAAAVDDDIHAVAWDHWNPLARNIARFQRLKTADLAPLHLIAAARTMADDANAHLRHYLGRHHAVFPHVRAARQVNQFLFCFLNVVILGNTDRIDR